MTINDAKQMTAEGQMTINDAKQMTAAGQMTPQANDYRLIAVFIYK